jgi:hypothetical protein
MVTTGQEYVPGVCNIGPGEIKKRKALGWIGLIASIALWAAFVMLKVAALWRLTLFVPAMLAALGFLQSVWHFCAKYGLDGVFKFGRNVGKSVGPEQAEFRRKDRRTALTIIGFSALVGLATAAAAFFTSP